MAKSVREQISGDIEQAKAQGQLRADRLRMIVRSAVAEAMTEIKAGTGEIGPLLKDAIATVIDSAQSQGGSLKDNIQSAIEGGLEAVNQRRREQLSAAQTDLKALQARVEAEEDSLQMQVDDTLTSLQSSAEDFPDQAKQALGEAIEGIKDSEEVRLMQKRYAQLRTRLAVLRANLSARYGDRLEEVQQYLDEAKAWYEKVSPRLEETSQTVQDKSADFQQQLAETGRSLARKEKDIKQQLKDLWNSSESVG